MLTTEVPLVIVVSAALPPALTAPVLCSLMSATDAGFWETLAALATESPLFASVVVDSHDEHTLIVHPDLSYTTGKPSFSYVWESPPDDRYGPYSDYAQLNDLAVRYLAGGAWRFRAVAQPYPVLRCDPVWISSLRGSPSPQGIMWPLTSHDL